MIYLDNAATTQPLPEVADAMLPFLRENYGNPSSLHMGGTTLRRKVEEARADVANLLGANSTGQILFTSGATESIALAFASINRDFSQIVTSAVEHSAVLAASKRWANGRPVISIPVDTRGLLDVEQFEMALGRAPSFVSFMLANNETGVLFDTSRLAQLCHQHRAIFHLDAAQGFGKVAVNVGEIDCDYLSVSAHKFHGPKGIGALYVRRPAQIQPIFPGHQESHMRAGTENVIGIIGFAAAARALADWPKNVGHMAHIRDELEHSIIASIQGAVVNGDPSYRIASISNLSLPTKTNSSSMVCSRFTEDRFKI